jgi:hypothetical protein
MHVMFVYTKQSATASKAHALKQRQSLRHVLIVNVKHIKQLSFVVGTLSNLLTLEF